MVGSSNARHLERLSGLRGRGRTFKAAELRWARQLLTRPAEARRCEVSDDQTRTSLQFWLDSHRAQTRVRPLGGCAMDRPSPRRSASCSVRPAVSGPIGRAGEPETGSLRPPRAPSPSSTRLVSGPMSRTLNPQVDGILVGTVRLSAGHCSRTLFPVRAVSGRASGPARPTNPGKTPRSTHLPL